MARVGSNGRLAASAVLGRVRGRSGVRLLPAELEPRPCTVYMDSLSCDGLAISDRWGLPPRPDGPARIVIRLMVGDHGTDYYRSGGKALGALEFPWRRKKTKKELLSYRLDM